MAKQKYCEFISGIHWIYNTKHADNQTQKNIINSNNSSSRSEVGNLSLIAGGSSIFMEVSDCCLP